jgi:hypothetical protein
MRGDTYDQIATRARMREGLPQKSMTPRKAAGQTTGQTERTASGYVSAREMRERKEREKKTLESRAAGNGHVAPRVVSSDDLFSDDRDALFRDPETGETFPQAKIRHEIARANERELIVAQRRGQLAPVARINQWFSGCILQARDIFSRLGPELRDRLAATTDPAECERLVGEEIARGLAAMKLFSTGIAGSMESMDTGDSNRSGKGSIEDSADADAS